MTETERLFEVFGELLYAIAMADGVIQKEELSALEEIVENSSELENKCKKALKYSNCIVNLASLLTEFGPIQEIESLKEIENNKVLSVEDLQEKVIISKKD